MKLLKYILGLTLSVFVITSGTMAANRSGTIVPDKKGATIKGTVSDGTTPLSGVVVSDGIEVTQTDHQGRYWLSSAKKNGSVFISIPAGYEVMTQGTRPLFWAHLTAPVTVAEQHDFNVTKVDNEDHILLAVTDMHLANLYNDIEQLCTGFVPSIKEVVRNAKGKRVYTLNTGDMSFDMYWHSSNYSIESYKKTLETISYPTPVFHAIGNHDNDPAVPCTDSTDFVSAKRYRQAFGPSHYSFNIGRIHYVVLDNIIYLNEPKGKEAESIVGSRNYVRRVTEEQLAWLKKDLELVPDKTTPIVVGMHAGAYHYEGISQKVTNWFSKPEYTTQLTSCFDGFDNVHYITGHSHCNHTTYVNDHLTEHNLGAVCGSWWVSGANHFQNLCPDGSPSGYGVFEIKGKKIEWHYQSIDGGAKRQFRAFDMNEVRRYYTESKELATFIAHYPHRTDFRKIEDNMIYLNVWNWAPDWQISVKENNKELKVEPILAEDPLYTISYELLKIKIAGIYPSSYKERLQNHIFRVRASSRTSTLKIKVTDRFGRIYTEHMERPKRFGYDMR